MNHDVIIVDPYEKGLTAEGVATLSALCSRSMESPRVNIEKVEKMGASNFMKRVYLGYGHESVGKMAQTNIFLSNVSMLCAKALQGGQLYVGQESSTRYITFGEQSVYLPESIDTEAVQELTEEIMHTYKLIQPMVKESLKARLTAPEGVSEKKWDATLDARVFDICRCLLPAGCKTVVVWNTHFENAKKELTRLMGHELAEVRGVAQEIFDALQAHYPASFSYPTKEEIQWIKETNVGTTYPTVDDVYLQRDDYIETARELLKTLPPRPKYAPYPSLLGEIYKPTFWFTLDYGSYRDIQRHRKGYCSCSTLSPSEGFEEWYLDQMPQEARSIVEQLLAKVENMYTVLLDKGEDSSTLQYFVPMGYKVGVRVQYPLENAVYVTELRSGLGVHPTLRKVAQQMGQQLEQTFPELQLYYNKDTEDTLDVRRADKTAHFK